MHFIFTLKYIAFYVILHAGKHIISGGEFREKIFCRRCVSRRRARRVCDIFRKYVFITYSARERCTQHYVYITCSIMCTLHMSYVCIISVHPLARSNWFNTSHLPLNIVCVDGMRVVCLCCALWVPEIRQKKNCLRATKMTIFTICLSLQAKREIPVFRVHPLARSTLCILSSRTFRGHAFLTPVNAVQIFVCRTVTCVQRCVHKHCCIRVLFVVVQICVYCYSIGCRVYTLHENENVSKY